MGCLDYMPLHNIIYISNNVFIELRKYAMYELSFGNMYNILNYETVCVLGIQK